MNSMNPKTYSFFLSALVDTMCSFKFYNIQTYQFHTHASKHLAKHNVCRNQLPSSNQATTNATQSSTKPCRSDSTLYMFWLEVNNPRHLVPLNPTPLTLTKKMFLATCFNTMWVFVRTYELALLRTIARRISFLAIVQHLSSSYAFTFYQSSVSLSFGFESEFE